jgi:flagellar M-ring protein FliF
VITLKTLEFDLPGAEGTPAEASFFSGLDPMALIQLGVAALVALVLGLFVLRPLLAGGGRRAETSAPLALPGATGGPVLNGEIDEGDDLPPFARVTGDRNAEESLAPEPDPVERLRKLIAERQTESVEILRAWMEDREEAK